MTISPLRFRRGLTVATSFLLTLGTASLAVAGPPEEAQPPAGDDDDGTAPPDEGDGGGDDDVDAETDEWGAIDEGDADAPPDEGGDAAAPPAGETPPDDDWDDDGGGDDDWEDEDDDWDGELLIEDVSDDPEAAELEQVEQVEVEGASGTISGVVKDTTTGDPLLGANVRALGTAYEVTTDVDGNYTLELPPGTYTLEFFYETFSVKEIANLEVSEDGQLKQNVELTPMAGMTTETVIEAEAPKASESVQLEARKEAAETKDVMSSEEMRKSGGGSTARLAGLIVGATLEDGRFLIVRGLSHRYGNTLFDGARLPSPNPELRTIPLDIFPSGALSSINIVKTFTPDQPADFTGASTQLESRDIPDDFTLNLSVSTWANTATTFRDVYKDRSFAADAFAFGNRPRGYPSNFPTNRRVDGSLTQEIDGQSVPIYYPEDIERFGEALFNETGLNESMAPPGYSVSATLGDNVYLGRGTKMGWVTSAKLSDEWEFKDGIAGNYNCVSGDGDGDGDGDGVLANCPDEFTYVPRTDYGTVGNGFNRESIRGTQLNGVGLLKFDIRDDHRVYANLFYSRDAEGRVRLQEGVAQGTVGPDRVSTTRHRYIMRSILFTQLGAEHEIDAAKGLTIDYFGSYSQARRDDPGVRDVLYIEDTAEEEFRVASGISPPSIQSLFLVDNVQNGALNFMMPFKQWKQLDAKVKFGGWAEGKQRDFESRRFAYSIAGGLNNEIPLGIGNALNNDTIGGGINAAGGGSQPFFLVEQTTEQESYFGRQRLFAGYTMLDLPFVRWFKIVGGVRFEHNQIDVGPFNFFDPDADTGIEDARLVENDFFPSVSLVFSPTDKMNVRLVGTQTIARPEFRELAPFAFTDFVGGTQTVGNRLLNSTRIYNADLRWEFFPTGQEVVAVSAFFKYMDDPIERALATGASTFISTFLNSTNAINVGGEVEFKKNLGFLGRRSKKNGGEMKENARWLEDLSMGFNFAYIYSRVTLPEAINPDTGDALPRDALVSDCPDDDRNSAELCRITVQFGAATSKERPLQGQSPWIVNGFLDYDNDRIGTNARVIYNAFGPRIRSIGGRGQGDEYQLQVHQLDLAFSQRIFQVADSTDSFEASTSQELRALFQVGNILNWNKQWGQFDSDDEFFPTLAYRDGVDFKIGLAYSF